MGESLSPTTWDKQQLHERLRETRRVVLELGCGRTKRDPDSIGVDRVDHPGVDVVGDALEVLRDIPRESVDHVFSSHFLEHIDDLNAMITESARVLRPGGTLEAVVPHHSNPWFYSDPTHRSYFGLYTMSYYAEDRIFTRRVPAYVRQPELKLVSVELVFKSTRPFYVRHAIKKLVQFVFNATEPMKELYEEIFSRTIPCYEIRYVLEKKATDHAGDHGRAE